MLLAVFYTSCNLTSIYRFVTVRTEVKRRFDSRGKPENRLKVAVSSRKTVDARGIDKLTVKLYCGRQTGAVLCYLQRSTHDDDDGDDDVIKMKLCNVCHGGYTQTSVNAGVTQ